MKHKKPSAKKKHEWSKIFSASIACIFGLYSIWCGITYYNLSRMAILNNSMVMPDSTLAVTCVSVVLGALLSYLLYQMGLKNSRNKFGIDSDGQPFKEKIIDYDETATQESEDIRDN